MVLSFLDSLNHSPTSGSAKLLVVGMLEYQAFIDPMESRPHHSRHSQARDDPRQAIADQAQSDYAWIRTDDRSIDNLKKLAEGALSRLELMDLQAYAKTLPRSHGDTLAPETWRYIATLEGSKAGSDVADSGTEEGDVDGGLAPIVRYIQGRWPSKR